MKRYKFISLSALCFWAGTLFLVSVAGSFSAHALNVIWWNTGGGYVQDDISNAEYLRLVSAENPDVLILGEDFSTPNKVLLDRFKYYRFQSYDQADLSYGISIYSNVPFQFYRSPEPMNWGSSEDKARWGRVYDSQKKYFDRYFISLTLLGASPVRVVPAHLLQPWFSLQEAGTSVFAGLKMLFNLDHPLAAQIRDFKSKVAKQGADEPLGSTLVLGDFNVPSSALGLVPKTYDLLRRGWYEVPTDGESNSYLNKFRLDHAFVVSGPSGAKGSILKYSGSDHLPLRVELPE